MKHDKKLTEKKSWVQPEWMAQYVPLLVNTGGTFDDPAEAMNCNAQNCNLAVNAPRALLCTAVLSQVRLLERLHAGGFLHEHARVRGRVRLDAEGMLR